MKTHKTLTISVESGEVVPYNVSVTYNPDSVSICGTIKNEELDAVLKEIKEGYLEAFPLPEYFQEDEGDS